MIKILKNILPSTTEIEVLEFKHAKNQFDKNKLGKYFSALSNEANLKNQSQAWLLFGIDNDKNIVNEGTTRYPKWQLSSSKSIS